jgi:GDPmannose 4,6-dehydratase
MQSEIGGHARDYVYAMWLMLQQDKPEDFVITTGETHSVREFVGACCEEIGIELKWRGEGVDEVGIDRKSDRVIIKVNSKYFRPTEVDLLLGDPGKANRRLGWVAEIKFKELAKLMMRADLERIKEDKEILY